MKNSILEYKLNWCLDRVPEKVSPYEAIIYSLLEEMGNDSNSAKLREDITKIIVGLQPSEGKHGYDDDFEAIEVKPKNFTGKTKLNGGGQFTDFTWKRDQKYSNDKVTMLVSGFYWGRLVFVVEFPYESLREKIKSQLERILPEGDIPNRYVRSASFSYLDWKDDFVLKYISPKLDSYKDGMVSGLYKTLTSK